MLYLIFFLRYACLFLSFLYPLVFLSSILSVVISLFSVMFFSLPLFHCIQFFMHYFLLFTLLLFILRPTFLAFSSFLFVFTSSPLSPFSLFSLFACLFTQGESMHTKQLCISLMCKIDHFERQRTTCGHNRCFL